MWPKFDIFISLLDFLKCKCREFVEWQEDVCYTDSHSQVGCLININAPKKSEI